MLFDHLSICFIGASLIMAPLTVIIISSQDKSDAKHLAILTLGVLFPLLLASCARFAARQADNLAGGLGMIVFWSALILAVGLGYRTAMPRDPATRSGMQGKQFKPSPWDDEYF